MYTNWSEISFSCLGLIALVVILTVIGGLIGQWAWAWVIPDVFAGAVEKGILPASITFIQALKLSVLISVFVGVSRGSSSSKK